MLVFAVIPEKPRSTGLQVAFWSQSTASNHHRRNRTAASASCGSNVLGICHGMEAKRHWPPGLGNPKSSPMVAIGVPSLLSARPRCDGIGGRGLPAKHDATAAPGADLARDHGRP